MSTNFHHTHTNTHTHRSTVSSHILCSWATCDTLIWYNNPIFRTPLNNDFHRQKYTHRVVCVFVYMCHKQNTFFFSFWDNTTDNITVMFHNWRWPLYMYVFHHMKSLSNCIPGHFCSSVVPLNVRCNSSEIVAKFCMLYGPKRKRGQQKPLNL